MKIKLLLAATDYDYLEHISKIVAKKYCNDFDISISSQLNHLTNFLASNRVDVALLEPNMVKEIPLDHINIPLLLIDESSSLPSNLSNIKKIRKYQRISAIIADISELCAEIPPGPGGKHSFGKKARLTAVWSPAGGSGKTTVALAYAAHKVSKGSDVVYLSLENFSSVPAYFIEKGKSMSTVFSKLDSNLKILLRGIRIQDSGSGIYYFTEPDNYDDINVLTVEDIELLLSGAMDDIDELVVDLSSQCDERIQKILELADTVMLVVDTSDTSQVKLKQFLCQHNILLRIQTKCVLINNKGARVTESSIYKIISLPLVRSTDPVSIYMTLSGNNFEW